MKTLRNKVDKDEILRRLEQIQPDSQRRWGRMTAQQMVCHLSDGLRMYMKERDVAMIPASEIQRKVLKWGALWAPVPWPHGFKTMPELEQNGGSGTKPTKFAEDMRTLRDLTERFAGMPRGFPWGPASPLRCDELRRMDAPGVPPRQPSLAPVWCVTISWPEDRKY